MERLLDIMARLRSPGGCPWDRQQTHDSLRPYVIEEAYEVVEAIDSGPTAKIAEELGDLLLQVAFHAQIATELGEFTFDDVVEAICKKLVRRHPHIFGDVEASDADQVLHNWERIKQEERQSETGKPSSILDSVPKYLPALMYANKIQEKAARVGFDWPDADGAAAKVWEEAAELKEAMAGADHSRIEDELGDLLFAVVNVARLLKVDPEGALRHTGAKFAARFKFIEARAEEVGTALEDMTLEEMDEVWNEAKRSGL